MIFRQLYDRVTSTYTYLLADADSREALLIDPVFEHHLRDLALLRELDLELRCTLDTHVHADHVTGAWLMKQAVGSEILVAAASGAEGADRYLDEGDSVRVGALELECRSTPGHTNGCMTYVLRNERMAFTGDALLIRGAGRTDFQQGSASKLFESVRAKILSLPRDYLLYPAHDYNGRTSTTVAEERRHNPRLGDGTRPADFIAYMDNLGLAHPNKIDVAVPANLKCGRPADGEDFPHPPDWGPVVRTFAGVLQVDPEWVYLHRDELRFLDVREQKEIDATPLGRIAGALHIPLSELSGRAEELGDGPPVITVCPAGARSARAAQILEKQGVEQVANLPGGLLRWRALGYPVER